MTQYNFKLQCGNAIIDGTKISVKAKDEHAARVKLVDVLRKATRDLNVESLVLLGTGKLTAAQMLGAAGGKKSKRVITPEDQRKMQEARRSKSPENVNVDLPDTAAQDSASKSNNPAVSG
jgi:hypothetical protein